MRGLLQRTRGLALALTLVFPCTSLSSHIMKRYPKIDRSFFQSAGADSTRNSFMMLQPPIPRFLALRGGENDLFDQSSRYGTIFAMAENFAQLFGLSQRSECVFGEDGRTGGEIRRDG